jgi:ribokinase
VALVNTLGSVLLITVKSLSARIKADNSKEFMGSIAVVGSTMIDMVTFTHNIPSGGQTVTGDKFMLGFGGKGANQAAMIARFNVPVYMVNSLGNDVFGNSYLDQFKKEQIHSEFVKQIEQPTGVASIWVEPSGQNRIIIAPGANRHMTKDQVENALNSIPDLVAVVGQFEIPQEITAHAFKVAKSRGAITVFNPAPSEEISKELLDLCDWVIPNEHEFADLHPQNKLPESDEVISDLAKQLDVNLVVTLGEAGAAFVEQGGTVVRVPTQKVKPVDTTGAGDSFVGAFTYGLAFGLSVEEAVDLGCRCAALGVTRAGTQSSYPTKSEAQEILRAIAKS